MQIKSKISKKGMFDISLSELGMSLLAVIIISIIVYAGLKIGGILIPNKDYDATIKSFDIMTKEIENLINDKNYANSNLLYFLDDNFVLIGYNYNDPSLQIQTCEKGLGRKKEALKQTRENIGSLCQGACLCLYKDTNFDDFDSDIQLPIKCKDFNEKIVFLTPKEQSDTFCATESGWQPQAYDGYYKGGNGHNFLIAYGFNTKEIYMDKFSMEDKTFIFLGVYENKQEDPIYKRRQFNEEQYDLASQKLINPEQN